MPSWNNKQRILADLLLKILTPDSQEILVGEFEDQILVYAIQGAWDLKNLTPVSTINKDKLLTNHLLNSQAGLIISTQAEDNISVYSTISLVWDSESKNLTVWGNNGKNEASTFINKLKLDSNWLNSDKLLNADYLVSQADDVISTQAGYLLYVFGTTALDWSAKPIVSNSWDTLDKQLSYDYLLTQSSDILITQDENLIYLDFEIASPWENLSKNTESWVTIDKTLFEVYLLAQSEDNLVTQSDALLYTHLAIQNDWSMKQKI